MILIQIGISVIVAGVVGWFFTTRLPLPHRNEIELLRRENAELKTKLDWYKGRYNGLLRRYNEIKEREENEDEPKTAVYESAGARYISGLND